MALYAQWSAAPTPHRAASALATTLRTGIVPPKTAPPAKPSHSVGMLDAVALAALLADCDFIGISAWVQGEGGRGKAV